MPQIGEMIRFWSPSNPSNYKAFEIIKDSSAILVKHEGAYAVNAQFTLPNVTLLDTISLMLQVNGKTQDVKIEESRRFCVLINTQSDPREAWNCLNTQIQISFSQTFWLHKTDEISFSIIPGNQTIRTAERFTYFKIMHL